MRTDPSNSPTPRPSESSIAQALARFSDPSKYSSLPNSTLIMAELKTLHQGVLSKYQEDAISHATAIQERITTSWQEYRKEWREKKTDADPEALNQQILFAADALQLLSFIDIEQKRRGNDAAPSEALNLAVTFGAIAALAEFTDADISRWSSTASYWAGRAHTAEVAEKLVAALDEVCKTISTAVFANHTRKESLPKLLEGVLEAFEKAANIDLVRLMIEEAPEKSTAHISYYRFHEELGLKFLVHVRCHESHIPIHKIGYASGFIGMLIPIAMEYALLHKCVGLVDPEYGSETGGSMFEDSMVRDWAILNTAAGIKPTEQFRSAIETSINKLLKRIELPDITLASLTRLVFLPDWDQTQASRAEALAVREASESPVKIKVDSESFGKTLPMILCDLKPGQPNTIQILSDAHALLSSPIPGQAYLPNAKIWLTEFFAAVGISKDEKALCLQCLILIDELLKQNADKQEQKTSKPNLETMRSEFEVLMLPRALEEAFVAALKGKNSDNFSSVLLELVAAVNQTHALLAPGEFPGSIFSKRLEMRVAEINRINDVLVPAACSPEDQAVYRHIQTRWEEIKQRLTSYIKSRT